MHDEASAAARPAEAAHAGEDDLASLRPRQLLRVAARAPDSYVVLLLLLVLDYVALNVAWTGRGSQIVRAGLYAVTVLLAFHTSQVPPRVQRVVRVALAITLLVAVGAGIWESDRFTGIEVILISILVLACPLAIGWRILHHRRVTRETIAGAVCIYVLIGLIFANFDYGIQLVSGTPFFAQPGQHGLPDFAYFSYITMATVGYGDLTPAPGLPRTMSVLDALIGQVFLVVLLARLVSLYRPLGWRTGLEERLHDQTSEPDAVEG
jgi:Ion channel